MQIGIDARLYSQTGVGRYIKNLISELALLDSDNNYTVYLEKKDYSLFELPNKNWKKRMVNIRWHSLTEQFLMPNIFLRDQLDVIHLPYFNVPIFCLQKYLLTIHDLIIDHFDTGRASTHFYPFYKAKRIGYKISLSLGIKRAGAITAISQTTKKEIIDHYRINPEKIVVTYDALDKSFQELLQKRREKSIYNFPYILYVGNAYPHKNLERLIQAFKLIRKKKDVKLIFVGEDSYFYPRLKKYASNEGFSDEIIFFGEADNKLLISLYTYASCLVFPSLMEGFGLPNFEAVACGVLPVVSDIPVFREIWDDNLIFFNPLDYRDIAEKILCVLHFSTSEYSSRLQVLKNTLNKFSWKKTAITTLKLYEQIFNKKNIL